MDTRWSPFALDSSRSVAVFRHPLPTFVDIISGVATDAIDLSQYVVSIKHTSKDADIAFTYQTQLDGAAQPKPGELMEIQLNGQTLWVGIIESIAAYNLQSGSRKLELKLYSRENTPTWKDIKRVTPLYASGTPVDQIANDVALSVGLLTPEIAIPLTSTYTVHSNLQLGNMSAWDILVAALASSGIDPFVDARGVLKGISRNIARPADIVLTADRLDAITASKAKSPITSVRVLWLDPALSEVVHQDQALGTANITAGFYQLHQNLDVYFSADRTQRAKGTYMVIKQSANSGLLPVCSENYVQFDQFHGQIQLTTGVWAPLLATASLAEIIADSFVPDGVITGGFIIGSGYTVPYGRLLNAAAEVAVMLIMMSIGTGMYEIRGLPYDLVNARNRTEATAKGVPDWLIQNVDIETDFVMNEAHAQSFAVRELIYRSRSASTYNASIVDDPRIEPGDILQFPDSSRLYVLDYERQLTHGSKALLLVKGFQANAPAVVVTSTGLPTPAPSLPTPAPPQVIIGGGASPPAPALALGLTVQTLGPNIVLGSNWYNFNFFGSAISTSPPQSVPNSDGSITLTGHNGNAYGATICTAYYTTVGAPPHSYRGIAFNNNFLFEAILKYPEFAGALPPESWPAFWALAIQALTGGPWNRWNAALPIDYGHSPEIDVFEFDGQRKGVIGCQLHDWYAAPNILPQIGVNCLTGGFVITGADLSQYHKYSFSNKKATPTTRGVATWYFDDVAVKTYSYDPYNSALLPPPVRGSSAGSILDARQFCPILGVSNPALPMTVKSASVWQDPASALLNLVQ